MAQYPATASGTFRLVTKPDTASATSLGSGAVASDGGISNTYGSWQQLIASTSAESYITTLGIHVATATLGASDMPVLLQLGTGGAGSEVTKWEALLPYVNSGTGANGLFVPLAVPFRVTSGKRIAARIRLGSANNNNFTVHVFGLPITQTEGN